MEVLLFYLTFGFLLGILREWVFFNAFRDKYSDRPPYIDAVYKTRSVLLKLIAFGLFPETSDSALGNDSAIVADEWVLRLRGFRHWILMALLWPLPVSYSLVSVPFTLIKLSFRAIVSGIRWLFQTAEPVERTIRSVLRIERP